MEGKENEGVFSVLLVEDDLKLGQLVKKYLSSNGFTVKLESRGDTAVNRIITEQPDIVILDLMLPGLDGLSICREVRAQYQKPILMLTARGDEMDEIIGLEVGADDYLPKPVRPRLLLTRIKALLRRSLQDMKAEASGTAVDLIQIGKLSISLHNRSVNYNGNSIDLTTAEFDLLYFLALSPGVVLSRGEIFVGLKGVEWDGLDRSIDLRIARLRKKLGDDSKVPRIIKSVRGTGYLLVAKP